MPDPSFLPPIPGAYAAAIGLALSGALGVLWKALQNANKRSDDVSERRIEDARRTVQALAAAQNALDALTTRVAAAERLLQRMVDRGPH